MLKKALVCFATGPVVHLSRMRRAGLTLAEVVVAIGILAVAGLAIISVFAKLVTSQSKSGYQTVARMLAQEVLEEASIAGPPLWGMTDPTQELTRSYRMQSSPEPVPFSYKLSVSSVRLLEYPDPMGEIYQLEVDVWWFGEGPNAGRTDLGRTSLKGFRQVYVAL